MKGSGKLKNVAQSTSLLPLETSVSAQIRSGPGQGQHEQAAADHDPETEERNEYRRPVVFGNAFEPHFSGIETVGVDQAAEGRRQGDREEIAPLRNVRPRQQYFRCRLLIVPSRLDGGHLRGLVTDNVFTVEVPEEHLNRHEHSR